MSLPTTSWPIVNNRLRKCGRRCSIDLLTRHQYLRVVIRQKPKSVLGRFRQHNPNDIAISTVTLAELRYGADMSQDPGKNHHALDTFVAPLSVVDFDAQAADAYGRVRAALESHGTPIGPLDTLIAAHAIRLGVTLVTNNTGEFSRVAGLVVEDWT